MVFIEESSKSRGNNGLALSSAIRLGSRVLHLESTLTLIIFDVLTYIYIYIYIYIISLPKYISMAYYIMFQWIREHDTQ